MLSFKVEMTERHLAQIVLPPSAIWRTPAWLGVEWLLWPEPSFTENEDLIKLKSRWGEPGRGRVLWENEDIIYPPMDFIAAMKLDEPTKAFILGEMTNVTWEGFLERKLFCLDTMKILLALTPLRMREWKVPWPLSPYPACLMQEGKGTF